MRRPTQRFQRSPSTGQTSIYTTKTHLSQIPVTSWPTCNISDRVRTPLNPPWIHTLNLTHPPSRRINTEISAGRGHISPPPPSSSPSHWSRSKKCPPPESNTFAAPLSHIPTRAKLCLKHSSLSPYICAVGMSMLRSCSPSRRNRFNNVSVSPLSLA